MSARRAHTAPSWWARPVPGQGTRFVQGHPGAPGKGRRAGRVPNIKATADYHFRKAAQEHPEMQAKPPCPGCGASTA